jgi:hypothetical protein
MKTPRIYIGALAVFCIAALVIGSAGAAAIMQKGTGIYFKNTSGKDHMNGTANMTLLKKECRTSHPDGFPAFANYTGKSPVNGVANETRMLLMLDDLTAKGYDVSAILTTVQSRDFETAHTLLEEFRTAHPDAFPSRGEGAGKGPMAGQPDGERMLLMLDNLTAQGYDVSAIRTAVTSGDYKTAMTLMKEFRTAYPDVFPAHVSGTYKGHMGGLRGIQK